MEIKRKKTILAACCLFFVLCASILFCACTSKIGTSASESGNQEEVVEIPNGEDAGTDEELPNDQGEDQNQQEEVPQRPESPDQPTGGDQSGQEEQQPEVVYEEEETILFANNGVGYVLNPFADGEFSFKVESDEVLIALPYFKSAIALSPVSVGETKLTVKIATDEKIRIKVYNIIVLPFDEVLNVEIESLGGKELKGGTRADGSYLIYNANVVSCRNLTIEDFSMEKSDNIFIVENSVVAAKTEDGGTRLSFSFCVSGGQEAKIKVFAENNFVNLLTPTIAEETYVVSEFLREISYSLTNEGKNDFLFHKIFVYSRNNPEADICNIINKLLITFELHYASKLAQFPFLTMRLVWRTSCFSHSVSHLLFRSSGQKPDIGLTEKLESFFRSDNRFIELALILNSIQARDNESTIIEPEKLKVLKRMLIDRFMSEVLEREPFREDNIDTMVSIDELDSEYWSTKFSGYLKKSGLAALWLNEMFEHDENGIYALKNRYKIYFEHFFIPEWLSGAIQAQISCTLVYRQ